ncbi:unnamed protein product [Moneuplotes crassus]|uniref:Uncharacterized protein n=1 Tax=Euplotes crassus TaxID=5936 RepID=A0AAD1XEL4_EUPCR|nr:unnamed protein product [Moneuplotes crassus]
MDKRTARSSQRLSISEMTSSNSGYSKGRNNRYIKVKPHNRLRNQSIDKTSTRTSEMNKSVDAATMRKSAHSFGLSFYRPPNNDYMWKKTPQYTISGGKVERYLDKHANSLKNIPCCTKYSKIHQWNSKWMGQFRRQKRVTMTQYFIDKAIHISSKTPASNQYKTDQKYKIKGNYKSSLEKFSAIDSITEEKKVIPAPSKYNLNHSLTLRKTTVAKIQKDNGKHSRMAKITKNSKPGPGSYDDQGSLEKTQWRPPQGVSMRIIKGASRYLDTIVQRKKKIPGVGNYKNLEKGYDITGSDVVKKRSKY